MSTRARYISRADERERARDVLAGGGEMGALMRAIDWSRTPVGPVESWPMSLRTVVSLCLSSRYPILLLWGPELVQFYNDAFRPVLGLSKHPAALGAPGRFSWAEIWEERLRPMFADVFRGTSHAGDDALFLLDRNGYVEETYFNFSYDPIRDDDGGVGGVFVACQETTERVLAARRLQVVRSVAQVASEAKTVDEACALIGRAFDANANDLPFAQLFLFEGDALRLRAWTRLASTDATAPAAAGAARSASSFERAPLPAATIVDLGPDLPSPTELVALPVTRTGSSAPVGALVVGRNVRRALDQPYREFLELVARGVSSALATAQAYQETKERADALAEIDRVKTAFFSNVSHEFRTPLTLMLGPAEEALAGDALAPDERERWSIVQRSALRLSKLVNTLLDFSRIEAGRAEASYEPTDLSALTAELASMFRSAIEHGGLAFRLSLPGLGERAYVDREMWEKIVLNLLSNALKFTFEGEVALSLALVDDAFELVVSDTGVGVPAGELPHLFDRFHRVKGARARTHEGTGIGLALVAELAKLHGGAVHAESVEGRGTKFVVRVPRGRAHLPADRVGAPRALASTSTGAAPYVQEALRWMAPPSPAPSEPAPIGVVHPQAAHGRAKILLADDNADMRDYVARLLRERWDVEAVGDGEAALASMRRAPPDLVLTDVMMPTLDGFGLLRAIRSDPALTLTPVILLSGRAGEEATAEALGAGANDYVVKPFSARELLVRVESKLAVTRAAREARASEDDARARLYGHFMQAPFPICVLRGPDYVVELANAPTLAAWRKDESAIGKPLLEALPELKGQPFFDYLDGVYRGGVPYTARAELARLVRAPGGTPEDVYFDFVYAPLRDRHGTIDGVLACGFDVTSQVRAAAELSRSLASAEASERQFRELVENLPELAWTARPDGFIDYFNRRWYEYTGATPEEMQGWGWQKVHAPATIDAVVARWQHSIESGKPFEMEFPLRGADGVFRFFLTRVRPLRDASGKIVRWFGSNTNIDERRRNDDFKETFLGILGHDLRNPLNTILTTARVLGMRPEIAPEVRTRMERVVTSGVRMQRMIEQLLDLTRARLAGGIPVSASASEIPLRPIVTRIVDEVRAAHPGSTITVSGECASRIDADRFEQVVSNLVGNAVTHGDPTRPIQITLSSKDNGVTLAVHNYGRAIEESFLPLVFNPFARSEKPRARSEGLGLGLYVSERIIDAHRGTLTVRSSEDAGTCFEVFLPRKVSS